MPSRSVEFVIVQAALPGRPVRNVGVLLVDHSNKSLHWKFIEDWRAVADEEDAEVLAGLAAEFGERVREMGGEQFLEHLEDTLSNTLLLSDRKSIELTDNIQASLEDLFRRFVATDAAASTSRERPV